MAIINGTSVTDTLVGTSVADVIDGFGGADTIDGGAGDDVITVPGGLSSGATILGGAGNDTITFVANGGGTIDAGTGNDFVTLRSYDTPSTVNLGDGDDAILVASSHLGETVTLGAGRDTVILDNSFDYGGLVVTDFQAGAGGDVLDLSSYIWRESFTPAPHADGNPFTSGHMYLTQEGADTIVWLDVDGADGGSGQGFQVPLLRLANVTASALTADNLNGWDPGGAAEIVTTVFGTAAGEMMFARVNGGTLEGLGGDDRLFGGYADDVLNGGAGNDTIDGGIGDDTLSGGNGNDIITDRYGNDVIDGGLGDDVIQIHRDTRVVGNPFYREEAVTITAGDGHDLVSIAVTVRDNTRYLGSFAIDLGAGNDRLLLANRYFAGTVTLGAGVDRIEFGREFFFGAYVPGDRSLIVADFQAGAGGDVIDLTSLLSQANPASANPFADGYLRLVQDGGDTLVGYDYDGIDGDDDLVVFVRLTGVSVSALTAANFGGFDPRGAANAGITVNGAAGVDVSRGSAGADRLNGNSGNDVLSGGNGNDIVNGNDGNDTLSGGAGNDTLNGGNHDDTISDLDWGNDTILGGAGNDTITVSHTYSYEGSETVTIDAGTGNDEVTFSSARPGTASIALGDGNDRVTFFGISSDGVTVTTGAGSDLVSLATTLHGQTRGELTVTDFTAGNGGDVLDWLGYARAYLQLGPDANPFALGKAQLVQSGSDVLLQLGDSINGIAFNPYTIVRFANTALASFTNANFGIDIAARPPVDTMPGTAGNDSLTGSAIDDRSHGLAGDDTLNGAGGNDTLTGGEGRDTLNGDANDDHLDGSNGVDGLFGGDGNDTLYDAHGIDTLSGGNGNDTIVVEALVDVTYTPVIPRGGAIWAGSGDDTVRLTAAYADYAVNAGAGNDDITIGDAVGNVLLTLGAGVDTVHMEQVLLNGGKIIITDFVTGNAGDVFDALGAVAKILGGPLQGNAGSLNPFELGYLSLKQVGADVELWINAGGVPDAFNSYPAAVFRNTTVGAFTAHNFGGNDPGVTRVGVTVVQGNYTIANGTTESATDLVQSVHYLGTGDFTFVNHGIAELIRIEGAGNPVGFSVSNTNGITSASFTNAAGGVFRVTDAIYVPPFSVFFPEAVGFNNGFGTNTSFANAGLFEVISDWGSATGAIVGYSTAGFSNTGTIRVTAKIDAIGIQSGGEAMTNAGVIDVFGGLFAVGIYQRQWLRPVTNTGTITVQTDPASDFASIGILLDENPSATSRTIINSGTINADYAIYIRETSPSGNYADTVTNSGTINGAIWLADGNDTVTNTGTISSATLLGSGDDTYNGTGGRHLGNVQGGIGNDSLTGGSFSDTFFGDSGSDLLNGAGGDDWLDGGEGSDLVDGGAGFDTLSYLEAASAMEIDVAAGAATGGGDVDYFRAIEAVVGSRGDDRILGAAGTEVLFGAGGNDRIDGRGGNDTLAGGTGDDQITTGSGSDAVLYAAGHGRDTILDFTSSDAIQVHGYTSARSITQIGADVRITFSATDSIIVKNATVAVVSPRLFFATSPFPIKLVDPPGTTLAVTEDLVVAAGVTLSFTDTNPVLQRIHNLDDMIVSYGIRLSNSAFGMPSPGLWNSGTIHYEGTIDGVIATGVAGTPNGSNVTTLVNEASGRIEVIGHQGDAVGGSILFGVYNLGAVAVTAENGNATGFSGLDAYADFVNAGSITVTSLTGVAKGTDQLTTSNSSIHAFNTGSLLVSGHDASYGFDLRLAAHPAAEQPVFVNSGTITVTDQTAARDSVALDVSLASLAQVWNSGTITADYVLKVNSGFSYSPWGGYKLSFYNSGQANGAIELSAYDDLLVNTGTITGTTWLGSGADVFDGRQGNLIGIVDGYDGNDTILTGAGAQTLMGGYGEDILSGGAGTDTLTGGAGRDHFRFGTGFGADTITDFAGGAAGDFIDVSGYASAQSVVQQGSDVLVTFSGSDTLLVRNATVASVTAAMAFGVADLAANAIPTAPTPPVGPAVPTGSSEPSQQFAPLNGTNGVDVLTGSGAAEIINGQGGNDTIFGLAGDDQINGGSGNDVMDGGRGHDSYVVDSAADVVTELAGGGNDTVRSSVHWTLGANTERLILTGGDAINATGNELGNFLSGNASANRLFGLAGNDNLLGLDGDDLLVGGLGKDTLNGGNGADRFRFDVLELSSNADFVSDFVHGTDKVEMARSAFSGFAGSAAGALDAAAFTLGTAATSATQRLIYDGATGSLYYDADGSGGQAQVKIASFVSRPALDAGDFVLI